MRKKVILLALIVVVGVPVVITIWNVVDAAMHGDWSGVHFFGGVAWVLTALYLVFAYLRPNVPVSGDTPSAQVAGSACRFRWQDDAHEPGDKHQCFLPAGHDGPHVCGIHTDTGECRATSTQNEKVRV